MGEVLHVIDFDQLKIENQQYCELPLDLTPNLVPSASNPKSRIESRQYRGLALTCLCQMHIFGIFYFIGACHCCAPHRLQCQHRVVCS